MGKSKIYAVAYGIDPNTNTTELQVINRKFYTWNECKRYVDGVPKARYKGFLTEQEADAWLKKVLESEPFEDKKSDTSESIKAVNEYNTECYTSYLDPTFKAICMQLGILPVDMLLHLQNQFVRTMQYIQPIIDKHQDKEELPFK